MLCQFLSKVAASFNMIGYPSRRKFRNRMLVAAKIADAMKAHYSTSDVYEFEPMIASEPQTE